MRKLLGQPPVACAAVTAAFGLLAATPAPAQTAPDGWATARPAPGIVAFTPPDLADGETFRVAVSDPQPLAGRSLTDWLTQVMRADPLRHAGVAKLAAMETTERSPIYTVQYTMPNGTAATDLYTVARLNQGLVRLIHVTAAPSLEIYARYKAQVLEIAQSLRPAPAAVVPVTAPPAQRGRLAPGGPLAEGVYTGIQVCHGPDGQDVWRRTYRLSLYKNGEYRMDDAQGKPYTDYPTGRYTYNAATGLLTVQTYLNLYNKPNEARCVYGHDSAGTPLIQAAENIFDTTTLLRYAGPPSQPSLQAQAQAANAARERILRIGAGVKPSQIAGVYAKQISEIGVGGFVSVAYSPVLALKDGTYCQDFDVPPAELVAAASRRAHPNHWGRWRGSGRHIQTLSDKGVWEETVWIGPLKSGSPGMRLSGTFTAIGGGGNTAFGGDTLVAVEKSFTFFPDGRFQASSSVNASTVNASSGSAVSASAQQTDGTYTIGSYAITLRFRDGTVRHWSFASMDGSPIYLHGESYLNWDHK